MARSAARASGRSAAARASLPAASPPSCWSAARSRSALRRSIARWVDCPTTSTTAPRLSRTLRGRCFRPSGPLGYLGLGRQTGGAPRLHAALEVEDVLFTHGGGQLGRDGAALSDLAHEDDVVGSDGLLGTGDDLSERRQRRVRDVIARVLPLLAHVDNLELAFADAVIRLLRRQSAEWLRGRLLVLSHCNPRHKDSQWRQ